MTVRLPINYLDTGKVSRDKINNSFNEMVTTVQWYRPHIENWIRRIWNTNTWVRAYGDSIDMKVEDWYIWYKSESQTNWTQIIAVEDLKWDTWPQWEKGDTWEKGDKWDKGDKGNKWDKGDKGDKWDTGAQWPQGEQWIQGIQWEPWDAFQIYKTYASISAMNADKANVPEWKFVMIASTVEDPDNAKLYVKADSDFVFLTDMSGATGIQWPQWEQGIQGIQWVPWTDWYSPTATVNKVWDTATVTITDKNWTTTAEIHDGEWDVVWPDSAIDWNVAVFDWTTWKLIKDSGVNLDDKQDKLTAGTDLEIVDVPSETSASGTDSVTLSNAIANGLNSVTLTGACELRELPREYTQVEYLQSDGACYIDLLRVPNNNDIIEQKFQRQADDNALYAWYGSMPSSSQTTPRIWIGAFTSGNRTIFVGVNSTVNITREDTNINTIRFQATGNDKITCTYNGETTIYTATGNTYEPVITLTSYLFARHGEDGVQAYDGGGTKIFYHKEYLADGTLALNAVPCRRNSDGVLGMYDTVTQRFLTNGGTGTFVAGTTIHNVPNEYTQLNYLRSNGGYIDTEYIPTANTSIEYNVAFASVTANNCLFGTRTSGTYSTSTNQFYWGVYVANSNKIYWYSGTTRTNTSIVPVNDVYYNITCTNENMTGTAEYPMALFALNNAGTVGSSTVMDLAYFKIYESNVLVRNLLPVKRNSDNALGMYDAVTNTFFAGTGDFIAGTEKTPTPAKPMNIICNNGTLKLRLKLNYDPNYNVLAGIRAVGSGAWFGTGISADINTEIEVEASDITATSTQLVVAKSPATTFFRIVKAGSSQKVVGSINSTSITSNIDGSTRFTAKLNKTGFYINDSLVGSIGATSVSNMGEIEVCHAVYGGTSYLGSNTTFHRVTIRQNGTVVFNGVPRQRISDGEIGLFDTVSNTLFTSTGNKEFVSTGLDPSAYELYVDGTTETVKDSLNNTATAENLLSVDEYRDVQNVLTGEVTYNVITYIVDGTEDWEKYRANNGFSCFRILAGLGLRSKARIGISNYLPYYNIVTTALDRECFTIGSNMNTFYITLAGENMTLTEFTDWLKGLYNAGNPFIVALPRYTSVTSSVTPQTLTTVQGDNTIEITQASIENLPIEVNYNVPGGTFINFTGTYQTVDNMVTSLTSADDDHYPTAKAVSDAIQSSWGGDMLASTYDPNNIWADAFDYTNFTNTPTIPSKTSDLNNDSWFITSSALSGYQTTANLKTSLSDNSDSYYPSQKAVKTAIDGKQDTLVNQTNIKSINWTSLLWSWDITTPNTTYTASDFDIKDLADTTGLRTTWSGKQDALTTQTAYSAKWSATKVPQITTNSLGQVTAITEKTITHPSQVSDTAYASSWNWVTTTAPSKNAVYDKIESLNLPIVSSTAPATPTEWMIWYDTTNDKLKTYNWSSWDEAWSGTDTSNTKTFYLSSTTDLTTAQAVLDWYLAGKNPIIIYSNRAFHVRSKSTTVLSLASLTLPSSWNSYNSIYNQTINIVYSNNTVTSINYDNTNIDASTFLSTSTNYSTPYTPQYDGSPATKKYVDDNAGWNTKTFYLSSTSDTTTAQAVLDWYNAGKNPIIIYDMSNSSYKWEYILSNVNNSQIVFAKSKIETSHSSSQWYSYTKQPNILISFSDGTVTGINVANYASNWPYVLATNYNYSTPYTPQYNWSPATKKYVDDSVSVVSGDSWTTYTIKVSNSAPASWTPNTTITFRTN